MIRNRLLCLALPLGVACGPVSPLDRAEHALRNGDPDLAYEVLVPFVDHNADSPDGQRLLAKACLETMRTWPGAKAAVRAVELAPDDARAHCVRARLEQRRFDNIAAVAAAREAVRLDPANPENHIAAGFFLLGGGRAGRPHYDDAEERFRAALELAPENDAATYGLARTLVEAGRPAEGRELFDRLIERGFVSAEAFYWRGLARSRARDFVEAEGDFRRAVSLAPQFPEAIFNLARALRVNRKNEEAAAIHEEYDAILERDRFLSSVELAYHTRPKPTRAALTLAPALASAGRTDEALRVLRTLCHDEPDLVDAHLALAKVAGGAEDWTTARDAVARALQLSPESSKAFAVSAQVEYRTRRFDDALVAAESGCRLNASDRELQLLRANTLSALGRGAEAVRILEELASELSAPRVLAALGRAYLVAGSPAEADGALSGALVRRPLQAEWLTLRGQARVGQGQAAPAKEDFREAITLRPHDPLPYPHLIAILRDEGNVEEAEQLETQLRVAKDHDEKVSRLRTAVARNPRDRAIADELSVLLDEAGLREEAARVRARACRQGIAF